MTNAWCTCRNRPSRTCNETPRFNTKRFPLPLHACDNKVEAIPPSKKTKCRGVYSKSRLEDYDGPPGGANHEGTALRKGVRGVSNIYKDREMEPVGACTRCGIVRPSRLKTGAVLPFEVQVNVTSAPFITFLRSARGPREERGRAGYPKKWNGVVNARPGRGRPVVPYLSLAHMLVRREIQR